MRVQIPAYTDTWMRGARFGHVIKTIVKFAPAGQPGCDVPIKCYVVKMDHPGIRKPVIVVAEDCTPV